MEKKQAILTKEISDGMFTYEVGELVQIVLSESAKKAIILGVDNVYLEPDGYKIVEQKVHLKYEKLVDGEIKTLEMHEDLSTVVDFLQSKPNIRNIKNLTSNIRL